MTTTTPQVGDGRANRRVAPFYLASDISAAQMPRPHVLKHEDCFAVFDALGDFQATAPAAEGLFWEDTRYLSQLALAIDGARPLLLSSTVSSTNTALVVDLTSPRLGKRGRGRAAPDTVHVLKSLSLGDDAMFMRLDFRNFARIAMSFRLAFLFDADFLDIFELRGTTRRRQGRRLDDETAVDGAILAYLGRDQVLRRVRLTFSPPPDGIDSRQASWQIDLPAKGGWTVEMIARCERNDRPAGVASRQTAVAAAARRTSERELRGAELHTSNEAFNELLARSRADLDMLVTETPQGPYTYAGLPWFSTPFGRDGLITALECLWLDPAVAAGTLRYLAFRQATSADDAADAEPGKILHEARKGEMAMLGEVPFRRYYGSIDATPLFVMLAAAYFERTGDIELIRELWPNIQAALEWMVKYGDSDGDGFLEYHRKSANGLVNQGWKDSGDAIFHADGRLVEPPVALAEVQSYAFAAYLGTSSLADALGETRRAAELSAAAASLKQRFDAAFWIGELGTYALALDRDKQPCRVRASNAGQVLMGGIASAERAARVAQTLMAPQSFSGWGIRTIAEGEARYSPMSYHNGSVWPHDNGLIAMGFGRYGLKQPLVALITGLMEASSSMDMRRLPELYCGFARRPGYGPTLLPVACAPQAWASASVIAMVGALLGLSFDPAQRRIHLAQPMLPPWIDTLELHNLRLGSAGVDLLLQRRGETVAHRVTGCDGDIEVVVTP